MGSGSKYCVRWRKPDEIMLVLDFGNQVFLEYNVATKKEFMQQMPQFSGYDFKANAESVLTFLATRLKGVLKYIVFVGELSHSEQQICHCVTLDFELEQIFFVDTFTATMYYRLSRMYEDFRYASDVVMFIDNDTNVTGSVWRQMGYHLQRYKEITKYPAEGEKLTEADLKKLKEDLVGNVDPEYWVVETRNNNALLEKYLEMKAYATYQYVGLTYRNVAMFAASPLCHLAGALCATHKLKGTYRSRGAIMNFATPEELGKYELLGACTLLRK
uniref:P-loop containing nucleoside triphosphate hydrolase n=1 Tax=Panagrellus redivivus TaxID=6233 RepID=A0A7E4W5S7_PANRE